MLERKEPYAEKELLEVLTQTGELYHRKYQIRCLKAQRRGLSEVLTGLPFVRDKGRRFIA